MTVDEAAEQLECKPSLVYKLCALGKLGYHRIGFGRGKITISAEDLKDYRDSVRFCPFDMPAETPKVRRVKGPKVRDYVGEWEDQQKRKRQKAR